MRVGVEDQSQTKRLKAFTTGFKEVMVRRSGSQEVLLSHEVKKAYSKVSSYLQRFEYEPATADDGEGFANYLILHFEPRVIDQLIQEAGLPIWGANRPLSLFWLAIEENFERKVVVETEDFSEAVLSINQQAKKRGIPVIFPLMDLEDQINVTQSDIWGLFKTPVEQASLRYAADTIVYGRVAKRGETYSARLSYINQDQETRINLNADSQQALYTQLLDHVSELLCQKFCVVEQLQSNQLTMQVSNVNRFADIKKMQNYLDNLSSIRKVEVAHISGSNVRLNISLLGDLSSLQEDLKLGQSLVEENEPRQDYFAKVSQALISNLNNTNAHNQNLSESQTEPVIDEQINRFLLESDVENNQQQTSQQEISQQGANQQKINQQEASDLVSIIYYRWQG